MLNDDNPTIPAIDRAIALCDAERATRAALRDEIASRVLHPEPGDRIDREAEVASRHAAEDAALLEDGFTDADGVTDRRLEPFRFAPGITWFARTRERLVAMRAAVAAHDARWGRGQHHPYRYIGLPGRAQFDGRFLKVGEVVLLNERQADAWQDRFEAVTEEEPVTS
ncbi:MAG TPA: hypothetical protein VFX12_09915 [Vicinamibacterales bacterium]|nr:hypothetical protein [Vicinamibacterales bacterium]